MESLIDSSRCRKSSSSSSRDMTSPTLKVLAWLNDNLSYVADTSCECCRSRRSCSFHGGPCLAVRGKILEDRLLRLNERRRTIARRGDELDQRRRRVEAMAMRILNSSGLTLDRKSSGASISTVTTVVDLQSYVKPRLTAVVEDVAQKEQSVALVTDVTTVCKRGESVESCTVLQSGKLTTDHSHSSRSGLQALKAAFRKMTSLVKTKPGTRTLTTQTSKSLLTMPLIAPPYELQTYYNKEGLKCTRC